MYLLRRSKAVSLDARSRYEGEDVSSDAMNARCEFGVVDMIRSLRQREFFAAGKLRNVRPIRFTADDSVEVDLSPFEIALYLVDRGDLLIVDGFRMRRQQRGDGIEYRLLHRRMLVPEESDRS